MFGLISTKRLGFLELQRFIGGKDWFLNENNFVTIGWTIARQDEFFNQYYKDVFSGLRYTNTIFLRKNEIKANKFIPLSFVLSDLPSLITKRKLRKLLDMFVYYLQKKMNKSDGTRKIYIDYSHLYDF